MLTGKPGKLRKRILQTFLYKLLFPISRPSPITFFFFSKLWFVLVLGNPGRVTGLLETDKYMALFKTK